MKKSIWFLLPLIFTLLFSCGEKKEEGVTSQKAKSINYEEPPKVEMAKFLPPVPKPDEEVVEDYTSVEKDEVSSSESAQNEPINSPQINKKKIIKNGSISIKTNDITKSKSKIDQIVKKLNAYYDSEEFNNSEQAISFDLIIRIPSNEFEKTLQLLEQGEDEITNKSIHANDVTEEFVDLETRLKNKKAYLEKYKQLLSRAATIKDILEIEENVRVIQEEIESKEGRLKYLSDQVAYSTLTINLYKEKDYIFKPEQNISFFEKVKSSLSKGWNLVIDFILWIIIIWPILFLLSIAYFVSKRIIKKRRDKKNLGNIN